VRVCSATPSCLLYPSHHEPLEPFWCQNDGGISEYITIKTGPVPYPTFTIDPDPALTTGGSHLRNGQGLRFRLGSYSSRSYCIYTATLTLSYFSRKTREKAIRDDRQTYLQRSHHASPPLSKRTSSDPPLPLPHPFFKSSLQGRS